VLPACNTEAMQLHLNEIATKVTPGAHAILILDQAGWHGAKGLKAPANISLLPLPPRSPELNPQENIWQFMRANWLSTCLQILRRHRRPQLLRLERAHRPALENNVHSPPRLGARRSIIVRVGIRQTNSLPSAGGASMRTTLYSASQFGHWKLITSDMSEL
jgi:hypothetical protein